MTTTVLPPSGDVLAEPWSIRQFAKAALSESAYLLLAWPLAVVGFTLIVTGLSAGIGLLITLIGLPVLVGTAMVARALADIERAAIRKFLGVEAPSPRYRSAAAPLDRPKEGWLKRTTRSLTDPQSYLDMLWALVQFPITTVTWVVTVTFWSIALGGITYPLYSWALPRGEDYQGLADLIGLSDSRATDTAVTFAVGVLFVALTPLVVRGLAFIQSSISRALLCSRAVLQNEIVELEAGKDAARSAEAQQLARLERDIHDGPQQRLVRLKLDLARLERQARLADPGSALAADLRATIESTQATLDELRSLSRGIAPPILADRGLVAACRESAARSLVPTEVVTSLAEVPGLLPPHVEQAAHFLVAEALTNVAKHSGASRAVVDVNVREVPGSTELLVTVSDDGVGGAHLSKGHGLVGLSERMLAAGGALAIDSPAGGPTVVAASLPIRES